MELEAEEELVLQFKFDGRGAGDLGRSWCYHCLSQGVVDLEVVGGVHAALHLWVGSGASIEI